jgi:hypothetical protein
MAKVLTKVCGELVDAVPIWRALLPLTPLFSSLPSPTQPPYHQIATQLGCRRRCGIWVELIRSAAASKMEDIVRTASPYCLDPQWQPGVDREMVLQQV